MKVEISNGELIDKLSILEIKLQKITDPNKIKNIKREAEELSKAAQFIDLPPALYEALHDVNLKLWVVEDNIRELDKEVFPLEQCVSMEVVNKYARLARSVYLLNDQRASIKKQINESTCSGLVEEKQYSQY